MNAQGWYSGDTHVHFLSGDGANVEAAGEDLNVVNVLQSQWGSLFTNTEDFIGRPRVSDDGRTIVYVSQENRQHFLGHLTLLGLTDPVMPWCSDGPTEAEPGGSMETTLSHWADACHAQGGTVVIPHLPFPNGEPAALIATGRADAVEMLTQGQFAHTEYYRYLNGGYRLPLVGGHGQDVVGGAGRALPHLRAYPIRRAVQLRVVVRAHGGGAHLPQRRSAHHIARRGPRAGRHVAPEWQRRQRDGWRRRSSRSCRSTVSRSCRRDGSWPRRRRQAARAA